VVIDEPLINHYGGTVAAPALRRIADQALRYLGVSPRAEKRKRTKKKINRIRAKTQLKTPPEPEKEGLLSLTQKTEKALGPNQILTPDLKGMSMKQAMETLAVKELRPLFMGTGFAIEQVPAPLDPVDRGGFVQVNFQPLEPTPEEEEPEKKEDALKGDDYRS